MRNSESAESQLAKKQRDAFLAPALTRRKQRRVKLVKVAARSTRMAVRRSSKRTRTLKAAHSVCALGKQRGARATAVAVRKSATAA